MDRNNSTFVSQARAHFARQLRTLRVARGYRTARSLAKALGIDENRYTRYERAEVEPDLALIQRICEALSVAPGQLLIAAEPGRRQSGDSGTLESLPHGEASERDTGPRSVAEALSWRLATAMTTLKQDAHSPALAPLSVLRETTTLFRKLIKEPIKTIDAIASDPDLERATPDSARCIELLIERLLETTYKLHEA